MLCSGQRKSTSGVVDVIASLSARSFLELAEGTYDVSVTAEASKTAAIGPARITIENGKLYTAIARDPDPQVLNDGLGLILIDDFVTP